MSKPVKQFRMGLVVAAVFDQESKNGTLYNVSLSRLYKQDDSDPEWQRSTSFGRDDMPLVMEVSRQAWTWIHETQQAERQSRREQSVTT